MPRELLLLRHGKSAHSADTDDYHRPLKDRGKRAAQRIGVWLAGQHLEPDHIVASPATRALVTAEKCCKAMGIGAQRIVREQRLYDASLDDLKAVLAAVPQQARRVLLVGHNPGLEELLTYLSASPLNRPKKSKLKLLPTAALARLEMPDDWQQLESGVAPVLRLVYPAELPKKFPFPGPGGKELRDRPAYYYTQSAVIPYRRNGDQLEVLVIRSSQDKHWVVPKGIADVGMSLQESAAREAEEEAGIEGTIDPEPLGSYSYPKWGATCTVTVFPMAVSHEIPDAEWAERHRGRQWVAPESAAGLLRQAELRPMVEDLVRRMAGSG